jgi:hypothetical protein
MAVVMTAAVTAVYAFVTLLLWSPTRRQAILTRQVFEASHLPDVSIRAEEHTDIREQRRLAFTIVFENHGPVVARLMRWEMAAMLRGNHI